MFCSCISPEQIVRQLVLFLKGHRNRAVGEARLLSFLSASFPAAGLSSLEVVDITSVSNSRF